MCILREIDLSRQANVVLQLFHSLLSFIEIEFGELNCCPAMLYFVFINLKIFYVCKCYKKSLTATFLTFYGNSLIFNISQGLVFKCVFQQ